MNCRIAVLLLTLAGSVGAPAQSSVWQHVPANPDRENIGRVTLTPRQLKSIHAALTARASRLGLWECDDQSWLKDLQFSNVSVAPYPVYLVEAGVGCARGGQAANGGMWLVALKGTHARVLASPDTNFNGWLYSILPQSHHGLEDIVLGWHMSAFEAGLTYFEFNGVRYRAVSSATLESNEGVSSKIIPSSKPSK